jgi:carboxyl-terminal processing protease
VKARRLLEGEHKDVPAARKLLLEIVQKAKGETLAWADIYLGYIEDRANNRQNALGWYQSAVGVKGASPASLDLARFGLQQPLLWIRHLDLGQPTPSPVIAPSPPVPNSAGYVTRERPTGLTPATNLSAEQRLQNFEALWSLIDVNYAHFKLKSIDWTEIHRRYQSRLSLIKSDDDFYLLMFQFVNELKDTHSWLDNYPNPQLADVPNMPIDLFRGRPYVIAGPKAGWEVISVDGMSPKEKMESLRPYLRGVSSTRAFERQASRSLLSGKEGENVTIILRSPGGQTETESVVRSGRKRGPSRAAPRFLTRQRFVHFAMLPSGVGYIKIESFNGREEITQEFDRALEKLREAPALILDIRDNPGGFGHPEIAGRFVKQRVRVGFNYVKNGPGHTDFARSEEYVTASGSWQYTRPVALLVNDVTGSAADLFANELRSAGRVITLGTTTHGNLSGVALYAVLPSALVVRISNGYVTDAKDRPIEVVGNAPDVIVDPDIQDYLAGRDPVLERAVDVLSHTNPHALEQR